MATLKALKLMLRQKTFAHTSSSTQSLSDSDYAAGFNIVRQGSEILYRDFIDVQLSRIVEPVFAMHTDIRVLEIGPGPETVLGRLPDRLRLKLKRYAAFEPNRLFASKLQEELQLSNRESPFPSLDGPADIWGEPFGTEDGARYGLSKHTSSDDDKFDIVLFCHSMYGMKNKLRSIEEALEQYLDRSRGGMVVVFHRDGTLNLGRLTCTHTTTHPAGVVHVEDDDEVLNLFAAFIAGFALQDVAANTAVKTEWRRTCRALGHGNGAQPGHLSFSSPEVVASFTIHATTLPELIAHVPVVTDVRIKNREACTQKPASILRPTEIWHIQESVRWALKHRMGLTVVGGSHSGHCLRSNVLSIDMSAFQRINIIKAERDDQDAGVSSGTVAVVEAGCKSVDVVRNAMASNLTVPLGSRPSVGAGLWLQGGIGHLARSHGLACDGIIGAVMVSVMSAKVLWFGQVPRQCRPLGAVYAENDTDLLWAIRGAGTNIGIVVSVTFKTHTALEFMVKTWSKPLKSRSEGQLMLSKLDKSIARTLPRNCSIDTYLYWEQNHLCLGVTLFESCRVGLKNGKSAFESHPVPMLGPEDDHRMVDGLELFDTEMYMTGMHGGHCAGKTSSFKRCIFLKDISEAETVEVLLTSLENRPTPLCYMHLLQGGGAIKDISSNATAFGCRDWDFACVVTGTWARDQDGTEVARATVQWVYALVQDLLRSSAGIYCADLGPDPRDAALAAMAFGTNQKRLTYLKNSLDPSNILAYACPISRLAMSQKLIILVTGDHGAGKDFCAEVWVHALTTCDGRRLKAHTVSISDAAKREYAVATGADLHRLMSDRLYKEQHRAKLLAHFEHKTRQRPQILSEHFMNVASEIVDTDVLFITGMRDEAPVAVLSHLVPGSKLLEVRVTSSNETRLQRRQCHSGAANIDEIAEQVQREYNDNDDTKSRGYTRDRSDPACLTFHNEKAGSEAARQFCDDRLRPLLHQDIPRLVDMVRRVPDFPRPGTEFCDVLGIAQHPGGLALCTSLLQSHFAADWAAVNVVASCESGGFVFAAPLATQLALPLLLIRGAGKLPPPTISVSKLASYISSSPPRNPHEQRIEIGQNAASKCSSVLVVDDVLSSGETLFAILQLLLKAGVQADNIDVVVVAEFPGHRGRESLRQRGLGAVKIRSLLVFAGT